MVTTLCILGIAVTIVLLLIVSILSAKGVKDAKSFSTGGNSGSWMVCGTLIGTMVGGQSTIGTAQLAFSFGLSAWWFTIGAAIGSIVLALGYARSLRQSHCSTLMEIIAHEYGTRAETIGSILSLLGIFISIVAQILASTALMTSLFHLPDLPCEILSAIVIMLFVLFGGIKSAGAGGLVKMILLYLSSLIAGGVVLYLGHGIHGLETTIQNLFQESTLHNLTPTLTATEIHHQYASLIARGPMKDLGSCISLILGVVCTQTYAQGIWSARTTRKAKQGALLCALLIPFIGAACTLVGLYMRGHYVTQNELEALQQTGLSLPEGIGVLQNSAQAFPAFILHFLPDWMGGILLGTLFVTILGGGSGLALGASTILVRDVYRNIGLRQERTTTYRLTIVAILLLAVVFASSFKGAFINDLGFLSLGLRATAILFPLTFALTHPGRFSSLMAQCSMIGGTAMMLVAKIFNLPGDPIFWGLGLGLLLILLPFERPPKKDHPITQ